MTANEYQRGVLRTASDTNTHDLIAWLDKEKEKSFDNDPGAIVMAVFGLCGEAGEAEDYLKKAIFHKHEFDRKVLIKELGDILWYAARLAAALDTTLEHVMRENLEKLRRRFPEGFSSEASIARVDTHEPSGV